MVKAINKGYTDTPISGVTKLDFPRGLLNYKSDFRIKSNPNGKEVVITNLTSPIDRPENIRLAYQEVQNVYSNTDVDPAVYAPSKRGTSILAQISETLSVTDSVDADYRIDLPISAHLVIKVPANEHINAAAVQVLVGRLLSSLFDTGSLTDSRLEAILRGSLLPVEL
jgi:hypothetical protein